MAQSGIALIAGLGNPGSRYAVTRHNAGFRFVEKMQVVMGFGMSYQKRFDAEVGEAGFDSRKVRVVTPRTFMNLSGRAIAPLASFYRILPQQILVVHDDLDLAPGSVRLKLSGGHGGHNGLRDLVSRLGSSDFVRLRIGIGHPEAGRDVSAFVLAKPGEDDRMRIEKATDRALEVLGDVVAGSFESAMTRLHTEIKSGAAEVETAPGSAQSRRKTPSTNRATGAE